ncbi:MAG: EF-P lysine aminoacylase EpmA [Candidatus Thiodiazotropha sp.]
MTPPDLWRPSASMAMLHRRARLLQGIRDYFKQAGVLEVETPVCSRFATTDPAIESFSSRYTGPEAVQGLPLYLQTSPEFPMKRLLCAGSGPIYQICKVFRDGELGRRHNPEFTLLEWYRPGYDHYDLMGEVAHLINLLADAPMSIEKLSYAEAFERTLQLNPHLADIAQLRQCALDQGVLGAEELQLEHRDGWLDLLLTHLIEPTLGVSGMTLLYDYPASQAALARVSDDSPPVAQRFELYIKGVEIANGFYELADPGEQKSRFAEDNRKRDETGYPLMPMDEYLLDALAEGLPACAGVAVGIDRLLMVLAKVRDISEVVSFNFRRA